MSIFRLVFLPELGRGLDRLRGSGRRLRVCLGTLRVAGGRPCPGRLLLPAGRAAGTGGGVLAALGAAVVVDGFLGLREAGAQTVDPGLFATEDTGTRRLLSFLSDFGDSGSPVLGQMLGVFNGGVMLLAGFLLVWHTVTGAVDTAREGRWGFGGWEVLRIVTAVALMAPIPGAGASGAQHIVVGLARLGGDFANLVWEPLAVETLGKGRAVVPWPRESAWRTVIGRTLVSEVCMHVANAQAAAGGDRDYVRVRTATRRAGGQGWLRDRRRDRLDPARPATRGPLAEERHYDGQGRGLPRDVCGALRFRGLDEAEGRGIAARGHKAAWEAAHPAILEAAREIGDRFVRGSAVYGQALPDVTRELDARGVADTYRAILELHVKQAGDAEQRALLDAVARDASEISWLAAASFVNTLSASAARIQAAAENVPEAALHSADIALASPWAKEASEAVVRSLAQRGRYEPVPLALATGVSGTLAPATGRGGTMMDRLMDFIDPETVIVADGGNPLLDLTATGFGLMSAGVAAIGVLSGVSVGTNFTNLIPLVGKGLDMFDAAWEVMDGLVTPLIAIVIVSGAVLAYVLPALPFIRFLFGILAWLLAIVEAMLAVTVFCAAHVRRGEGNRLILSDTRQGWLFLPGLILRPVLMLFGLVIGYFLFLALMAMFNQVWVPRMVDANASSGLDAIDFAAMLALYVMVAYGLLNASFKLIDILPDAVLAWIGGRAGGDAGGEAVAGMAVGGFGRAGAFRGPGRFGGRRMAGGDGPGGRAPAAE